MQITKKYKKNTNQARKTEAVILKVKLSCVTTSHHFLRVGVRIVSRTGWQRTLLPCGRVGTDNTERVDRKCLNVCNMR